MPALSGSGSRDQSPCPVSYRHPRFLFVDDPDDHPADRAFRVVDGLARGRAIGGNDDPLMHRRAMSIDRDLRHSFRFTRVIDRLANNQPPALEAGMLAG